MIYVYEEFSASKDASSQMFNGHAVALMLLKRFGEAEDVLLEAQKKNGRDADVQANLVACYSAMGNTSKSDEHLK